jgi:hypothetical protein
LDEFSSGPSSASLAIGPSSLCPSLPPTFLKLKKEIAELTVRCPRSLSFNSSESRLHQTKTKSGYQFSHDKVQTSVQSTLGETKEARLHPCIGERFLALRGEGGHPEYAYQAAVVHFNQVPDFYYLDKQHCVSLACANLAVSKSCIAKSAFADAAVFL